MTHLVFNFMNYVLTMLCTCTCVGHWVRVFDGKNPSKAMFDMKATSSAVVVSMTPFMSIFAISAYTVSKLFCGTLYGSSHSFLFWLAMFQILWTHLRYLSKCVITSQCSPKSNVISQSPSMKMFFRVCARGYSLFDKFVQSFPHLWRDYCFL